MIWDYGPFTPCYDDLTDDDHYFSAGRYTSYKAEAILGIRGTPSFRDPQWHVTRVSPPRNDSQEHFRFPDEQRFSSPEEQRKLRNLSYRVIDVSGFHFDSSWPYFAAWANNGPTEVLLPDGEIFIPEAEHLIVIDNRRCQHRTGRKGFDASTRWFYRHGIVNSRWTPDPKYLVRG